MSRGECTRRVQSLSSGGDVTWISAFWPTDICRNHYWKKNNLYVCHISLKSWRGHGLLELFGAHVCVYVLLHIIKLFWPDQPRPLPLPLEIKNIKTLKQEIRKKTKLSAILFYGGEVDMSAQWDPASNMINTFFIVFHFRWQWVWFKDQKKQNSFQIWYIYGSVTFFQFFLFFFLNHCVPSVSL